MKYLLVLLLLFSMGLQAKEIVCIAEKLDAPFDEIILSKPGRGNIYSMRVVKEQNTLLSTEVSYLFSRRNQLATFKNNDKSIEIKTLRLIADRVTKSSIRINSLYGGTLRGFCKLYQ